MLYYFLPILLAMFLPLGVLLGICDLYMVGYIAYTLIRIFIHDDSVDYMYNVISGCMPLILPFIFECIWRQQIIPLIPLNTIITLTTGWAQQLDVYTSILNFRAYSPIVMEITCFIGTYFIQYIIQQACIFIIAHCINYIYPLKYVIIPLLIALKVRCDIICSRVLSQEVGQYIAGGRVLDDLISSLNIHVLQRTWIYQYLFDIPLVNYIMGHYLMDQAWTRFRIELRWLCAILNKMRY